MRSIFGTSLALILLLAATAQASAATRYVEKTGSDASDCTSAATPCATVGYAVEQALDGDTIQIGTGTFTESVSTEKVLIFVGQGAGSLPGGGAATVIQGPAGGLGEFGKTALRLRQGGAVEGVRLIGGKGGPAGEFGELGGDGIEYDANSTSASSLSLGEVVAIGGAGGPGSQIPGPGGRGVDVRDGLGPSLLLTGGSDFAGGDGFGPGIAVAISGDTTTATVFDARIANDDSYAAGVVVFGGARVFLNQLDVRSHGEGAVIYDGLLTVRNSRLHTGQWGLSVYPSSNESPELEVRDSLVVSDEQEALFVESEEGSPAAARVFGSTLIGRGYAAVAAKHEAGEGPATVTLRNSIARHYPPAEIVPRADLLANGGTIEAENSSFDAIREENEGTAPDPGSGSNLAGDPGFVDPAGDVYVLQNTSPLIDRGDPAAVEPEERDLLGSPRVLDGNRDCLAVPDVGAFEVTGQEATCPDPPPAVSAFGITNKVFAPTGKAAKASASARRVKRGTRLTYTLSEPARIAITIARKFPGRRLGKGSKSRCVKVTPANRDKGKACARFVKKTTLTAQKPAGRQSTPWNGHIGKKPAPPGKYRATIVATDGAGQSSQPRRLGFKIVSGSG
jgi:hypothetical protein